MNGHRMNGIYSVATHKALGMEINRKEVAHVSPGVCQHLEKVRKFTKGHSG